MNDFIEICEEPEICNEAPYKPKVVENNLHENFSEFFHRCPDEKIRYYADFQTRVKDPWSKWLYSLCREFKLYEGDHIVAWDVCLKVIRCDPSVVLITMEKMK